MALLTVSKESQLTEAGNSVVTASVIQRVQFDKVCKLPVKITVSLLIVAGAPLNFCLAKKFVRQYFLLNTFMNLVTG